MPTKFHPYHMVTNSPWPLLCSLMACFMAFNMNTMMTFKFKMLIFFMIILMTVMSFLWWKDASREASFHGLHQADVTKGLKMGMLLFIVSEVMFFSSFFWSFFHFSLSPSIEMGQSWPPLGITSFNPMNVPLLNTIILISSGASITWAHHSLMNNKMKNTSTGLTLTWMLGIYFSILQYMEYSQAEFNISDSSYGNIFFIATGFHGLHVMLGSFYLVYSDYNLKKLDSNKKHFLMMDLSAWYWHFVDVVWLFLYLCLYWWGA